MYSETAVFVRPSNNSDMVLHFFALAFCKSPIVKTDNVTIVQFAAFTRFPSCKLSYGFWVNLVLPVVGSIIIVCVYECPACSPAKFKVATFPFVIIEASASEFDNSIHDYSLITITKSPPIWKPFSNSSLHRLGTLAHLLLCLENAVHHPIVSSRPARKKGQVPHIVGIS